MPIPIPFPPSTPPSPPPAPTTLFPASQKTAFFLAPDMNYAEDEIRQNHIDALYRFGEYTMFVLMWHADDFEKGLVGRCTVCMPASDRIAKAYRQAPSERCLGCFGTTFEGGYRARIVRPAMWTDRSTDTVESARGTVLTDTVNVETTADFKLRHRDYMFRFDGTRYSTEEMSETVVRSGFSGPTSDQSVGGIISNAHLEDDASVAYLIPPTADQVATILGLGVGAHAPVDFSAYEVTDRGPLL